MLGMGVGEVLLWEFVCQSLQMFRCGALRIVYSDSVHLGRLCEASAMGDLDKDNQKESEEGVRPRRELPLSRRR